MREALELAAREGRVAVGGREVRHHPDDVARRRAELGDPPAAHARVELDVHGQALGDLRADDELEPRLAREGELLGRRRTEHQDPRRRQRGPQLERLGNRRDAKDARARLQSAASAQSRAPWP